MSAKSVVAPLAIGMLLTASGALAGNLSYMDTLQDGNDQLRIATDFDSAAASKIALIGIFNGQHKAVIAFTAGEWPALMALWSQARAWQSGGWKPVGAINETDDPSKLSMSAGSAGVMLTISPSAPGSGMYVILPAELDRFGADLQKIQSALANQSSE